MARQSAEEVSKSVLTNHKTTFAHFIRKPGARRPVLGGKAQSRPSAIGVAPKGRHIAQQRFYQINHEYCRP